MVAQLGFQRAADGQAVDHLGVLGFFDELRDGEVVADAHEAEALDFGDGKGYRGYGYIGTGGDVLLDDFLEIHPVELVAGEDEDVVVGEGPEMLEITADGIGGALIPVGVFLGLLGRKDVHKTATKGVEMEGVLNVPVE